MSGNEIIAGIGEISAGQVGVKKAAFAEVGAGAVGIGQITLVKVGFFGHTISDDSPLQIQPHEGVVTEIAGVKFQPLNSLNFGPIDAHQLAILKFGSLKGAIFDLNETQIAILELAVAESAALKVGLAQVAIFEGAVLEGNGRYHLRSPFQSRKFLVKIIFP